MAKRYGICPVIGSGTEQEPYRCAFSDVSQTNVTSLIPSKVDGAPKYNFAFAIVGTQSLPAVLAVTNSFVFPDFPLDAELGSMESAVRTAMVQSVEAYNLDGQGYDFDLQQFGNTDSYRQLIDYCMKRIEPFASVNNFDVSEPAE